MNIMQIFKFKRKKKFSFTVFTYITIYDAYIDRRKDNGYLTSAKQLKPKELLES